MSSSGVDNSGTLFWPGFAILRRLKSLFAKRLRALGPYLFAGTAFAGLVVYYLVTADKAISVQRSFPHSFPYSFELTWGTIRKIVEARALFFSMLIGAGAVTAVTVTGALLLLLHCKNRRELKKTKRLLAKTQAQLRETQTQLVDMQAKLQETEQRLARAEAQVELAERVAHDIRSPLSVLNVLSGEMAGLSPEKRDLIKQVSVRIDRVARDLLDFRERLVPTIVKEQECFLASAVETIVAEKRVLFKKTKITVSHDVLPTLVAKISDAKLRCVLSNVLNNSMEASPPYSTIDVRLSTTAKVGQAVIVISDQGEGISSEAIARIGTRGFSCGKSRKMCDSGYGLGLYHARQTLETYGASLSIVSEPGRGTTVRIQLPTNAQACC